MKALVHLIETETDYVNNEGARICEIVNDDETFEVHSNLIWVDCNTSVTTHSHFYVNGNIVEKVPFPSSIEL